MRIACSHACAVLNKELLFGSRRVTRIGDPECTEHIRHIHPSAPSHGRNNPLHPSETLTVMTAAV